VVKNLTVGYGSGGRTRKVACNLCAEVLRGSLTCLLGVNGAGKSTLIRTISGLQRKLCGEIVIEGKRIEEYSGEILSKTIGVVLTGKDEMRGMSVHDIVGLGRHPYTGFLGRMCREDERAVNDAINCMKINSLDRRLMHTLSDGERQKVMIARVLAQETPVILLDEPTAFLDFPSRVEIMRFLVMLAHDGGKTVFISTHDLELALQMADKLWILSPDGGLETGQPGELVENGSIERFFGCEGVEFNRISRKYIIHSAIPMPPVSSGNHTTNFR
jgi:iron complex transport system ATP-binding protein